MTDQSVTAHLAPGGMLMIMSDGIIEAFSAAEEFGVERVCQILDKSRLDPPEAQLESIRAAVREWQGHDEPRDDQTIVIARRVGSAPK